MKKTVFLLKAFGLYEYRGCTTVHKFGLYEYKGCTTVHKNLATQYSTRLEAELRLESLNDVWRSGGAIIEYEIEVPDPVEVNPWVLASDRLPVASKENPHPHVEVIMQCRGAAGQGWQRRNNAHIRYFGGDASRPYWANSDDSSSQPIENDTWFVTHWRDYTPLPDPVTDPAKPY